MVLRARFILIERPISHDTRYSQIPQPAFSSRGAREFPLHELHIRKSGPATILHGFAGDECLHDSVLETGATELGTEEPEALDCVFEVG